MIASKRFTFVDKENYEVDLEYNEQYIILHLPFIKKLNKSTYLDMHILIKEFWSFTQTVGYAGLWLALKKEDVLLAKLATKLGFTYLGEDKELSVFQYEE